MLQFSEHATIPWAFQSVSKIVYWVRSRREMTLPLLASITLIEPATDPMHIKFYLPDGCQDTVLICPSRSVLDIRSSIIDVTDISERSQIRMELSYPTEAI